MLDNTRPASSQTPAQENQEPQPQCFVSSTLVDTSFGRVRIAELAALSSARDAKKAELDSFLAQLEASKASKLANFDASATSLLSAIADGGGDVEPMQQLLAQERATLEAQLVEHYNQCAAEAQSVLSAIVPQVYVRTSEGARELRPIVKAWQSGTATSLVDVKIGTQVAQLDANTQGEQPVKIRCTPQHLFITTEGDVEAQSLAGKTVYLFDPDGAASTYVVEDVQPVEAEDALAVFDVEVEDVHNFCVGAGSPGPTAVVHNSASTGVVSTQGSTDLPSTGTDDYSAFIHKSRYARWRDGDQRRETWAETVDRYFAFFRERYPALSSQAFDEARSYVFNLNVMPSMRALWSAGPSLARCNVVGYNCAYVVVDSPRAFDEAVYILMSGCGLGFSVERQHINKLPRVSERLEDTDTTINVADSRTGWARAYKELISLLYAGQVPRWDLSKLRPAGARLKTSGGRSSGPQPLEDLFRFTVETFRAAEGRRLNSLECHDLMCMVGRIVVAGGVRRSAQISLSNPSDDRLRAAKSGRWWDDSPQRSQANNSAAYTERPDFSVYMREWWALHESKSGERGIFNRVAAQNKALSIGREVEDLGTNPCAEISLRSCQFCNLTEVVVRPNDTLETLKQKVRQAAFLGTLQSDLTDLKYLRKRWRDNCEDERLLGVSLTGIMDHAVLGNAEHPLLPAWLAELRKVARATNEHWAAEIGINPSKAITTVKPSGTVSQLVNSASGIHPRFARYYIRRVRADAKDPLAKLMISKGFPYEPDAVTPTNLVFSFPIKSPEAASLAPDIDALTQCRLWATYAKHWADHSVSCTVYYSDDEFLGLGQWVWEHFDEITGLSFLPRADHTYSQAPYEEISEAMYRELVDLMPSAVDWAELAQYESDDNTKGHSTVACAGGACEIVDLT